MAEHAARSSEHRPRLGRGLAALLGPAVVEPAAPAAEAPRAGQRKVPIEFIRANPRNPRKNFSESDIEDLAASVRERGVIQPILVRTVAGTTDAFEIVAGERRWRAAQRAGLHEMPILVLEATDKEALAIAIIENVQRADLNALEEASGYHQLMEEHGYSQAEVAHILGKSRSHVANTLRLMNLPSESRALLAAGQISAGHARALLALPDPDAVAKRIVTEGLTVRDIERLAQTPPPPPAAKPKPERPESADADTRALEKKLSLALGVKTTIRHDGQRGEMKIAFANFEQLDDLCRKLGVDVG
jgi:ParB family transcriptional regulator, chromosome partitioning protein